MKRFFPVLAAIPLFLCSGCMTYFGIGFDKNTTLVEPASPPDAPDFSQDFATYHNFAAATDPSSFAELTHATDMGRGGLMVTVGKVPLRNIAARGIQSLVERHFRAPLTDERPAFVIETTPQLMSIRQDGRIARVKMSVAIRCIKQDETRMVLLSKIYKGERTGPWVKGQVPAALYEALNDIWAAFLLEFRDNVRPESLMDGTESSIKMPELQELSFETKQNETNIVIGTCSVACNDWEPFQAAAWAKKRILTQCVEHLGIEKERVRIRYDDDPKDFDSDTKTWNFKFSTWARTRIVMQYNASSRRGRVMVDLGLSGWTSEEAADEAKKYITREMNLRAATYAEDIPEVIADINFLSIETDVENNLLILIFELAY